MIDRPEAPAHEARSAGRTWGAGSASRPSRSRGARKSHTRRTRSSSGSGRSSEKGDAQLLRRAAIDLCEPNLQHHLLTFAATGQLEQVDQLELRRARLRYLAEHTHIPIEFWLCAVALGLDSYDSGVVHGHRLPRAEVGRVIGLLRSLPLVERRKLPGLPEGRADVLFAGATILEHILERFGTDEVTVSDQGVRWGLLWREIDRRYPPPKLAVDKP